MKTKTNKTALIPKLRFPEFKNAGPWEVKRLGEVFNLQDGYPFSSRDFSFEKKNETYQVVRITEINIKNKNEDKVYISYETVKKNNLECFKITKGDLLLSLTGAAGFNFFIWNENKEAFLNQRTLKLVPKVENNNSIKYLVEPLLFKKINSFGTGQNNNLSKSILENLKLPLPTLPEQQKIAGFLSNLDEWLAAEEEKLTLLETYKKGLLQNLFPAQGETVPKLRFPEFKNSGEWEVKRLGEVGEFFGGGTPSTSKAEYWNGNVPWISSSDIHEDDIHNISINKYIHEKAVKATATKIIPKGSLLFVSRVGVGKLAVNKVELCTSQDFANFVPKKNISIVFLGYYWLSKKHLLISLNQGTSIKGFTKGDLETLKFSYPHDLTEQQKIADCLSALDEQIEAQRQKVEQLREHKKGLLQNLFPKFEF